MPTDKLPHEADETDILYHYTNLRGFTGIVSSKRVWASHYKCLRNDPDEITFGIGVLEQYIREHRVDPQDEEYKQNLLGYIRLFKDHPDHPVYVVSFTAQADSLHHWGAYSNSQIAIGFDANKVRQGFEVDISRKLHGNSEGEVIRQNPNNAYITCKYDGAFDFAEYVARTFFKSNSYPAIFRNVHAAQSIPVSLRVSIYRAICAIKGSMHLADLEYRTANYSPDPEDYPVKTLPDRTYIELRLDPLIYIKEVWIGPGANSESIEIVNDFLQSGLLNCPVHSSHPSPAVPAGV